MKFSSDFQKGILILLYHLSAHNKLVHVCVMVNFGVHRFRFGDVLPSAIKSIASDPYSSYVAIGREDGDIEIVDSSNKWYTVAQIAGQKDFELKVLVWSTIEQEKGRLFGISQKGFIFEVDLASLSFKNVQETYGGISWSLSACQKECSFSSGMRRWSITHL